MRRVRRSVGVVALGAGLLVAAPSQAETLKAAHGVGDALREVRHRSVEVLAKEVAARRPSLSVKIYPRGRLFSTSEIWDGLVGGTLEIAVLPLARLQGLDPIFALPSAPGQFRAVGDIQTLAASPLMSKVRRALADRGVRVLVDLWLPGAFLSRDGVCRHRPQEFAGLALADGGRPLGRLLQTLGTHPLDVEVDGEGAAAAPQARVLAVPELDLAGGATPGPGTCVTLAGDGGAWLDYQPLVISERAWGRLGPEDQKALQAAAAEAEGYARVAIERSLAATDTRIEPLTRNGAAVAFLSAEDALAWAALARPLLDPVSQREAKPDPGATAGRSSPPSGDPVEPPVAPAPLVSPPAPGGVSQGEPVQDRGSLLGIGL